MTPEHREATRRISSAIRAEEERLRTAHRWLAHQDALAVLCFTGAFAIWALVAWGTVVGLPWWIGVPAIAMAISILHELEHDLIHDLYFPRQPLPQNLLFTGIFFAKMSMDPWSRRALHLRHHRVSGQPIDIEERLIGLGLPLGPKRIALTVIPALSAVVLPSLIRDLKAHRRANPGQRRSESRGPAWARLTGLFMAFLPLITLIAWLQGAWWAGPLAVLYVLPNLLRHAAIAFTSSMSHYYAIEPNDVFVQNQILDHWLFAPLQLFCFNFGATHVLHHYVVRQPFYLRQLVAPGVKHVLIEQGVRHNDLGTIPRANRWD